MKRNADKNCYRNNTFFFSKSEGQKEESGITSVHVM